MKRAYRLVNYERIQGRHNKESKGQQSEQEQVVDERTGPIERNVQSFNECNLNIERNFPIQDYSPSNKEFLSYCQKLFPLNQGKGNYWSVMREYVKRFELLEGLDKLCHQNANVFQIKRFLKSSFLLGQRKQ